MFVVTTPTGNVGAQLLPLLLETGAQVRAIARSLEKLAAHPHLEIIEGSTDDADVLARFRGSAIGLLVRAVARARPTWLHITRASLMPPCAP